jgi:hypothetical protein
MLLGEVEKLRCQYGNESVPIQTSYASARCKNPVLYPPSAGMISCDLPPSVYRQPSTPSVTYMEKAEEMAAPDQTGTTIQAASSAIIGDHHHLSRGGLDHRVGHFQPLRIIS